MKGCHNQAPGWRQRNPKFNLNLFNRFSCMWFKRKPIIKENIKILRDPRDLFCLPAHFPNARRRSFITATVLQGTTNKHPQLPPKKCTFGSLGELVTLNGVRCLLVVCGRQLTLDLTLPGDLVKRWRRRWKDGWMCVLVVYITVSVDTTYMFFNLIHCKCAEWTWLRCLAVSVMLLSPLFCEAQKPSAPCSHYSCPLTSRAELWLRHGWGAVVVWCRQTKHHRAHGPPPHVWRTEPVSLVD